MICIDFFAFLFNLIRRKWYFLGAVILNLLYFLAFLFLVIFSSFISTLFFHQMFALIVFHTVVLHFINLVPFLHLKSESYSLHAIEKLRSITFFLEFLGYISKLLVEFSLKFFLSFFYYGSFYVIWFYFDISFVLIINNLKLFFTTFHWCKRSNIRYHLILKPHVCDLLSRKKARRVVGCLLVIALE